MKISISSNLQQSIKRLGSVKMVMQKASAETLRNAASQTGREAARMIRDTKYAPKLTISEILQGRKTQKGGRYGAPNGAMVWSGYGPRNTQPINSQTASVFLTNKSIGLTYFNPQNMTVSTKYGPRYGVIVTVYGKKIVTGGFHLKSPGMRHGSPKGVGTFDKNSKVFIRDGDGIRMYKFISPARLLDNNGRFDELEFYGGEIYRKQFARNFDRYMRMAMR